MELNLIYSHFSKIRFERYLIATENDINRAIKLYKNNLRVSQSFLPLLGILEVILRNEINSQLINHFGDEDWIINQQTGFMKDPKLTYIKDGRLFHNHFLKNSIDKSIIKFTKKKVKITSGKIIADQDFSFWTELFELTYYKILKGKPIQIFNKLPTGYGRKDVLHRITEIRKFRNRISHNEPICFIEHNKNLSYTEEIYNYIIELLLWINPELLKFTSDIDHIILKIRKTEID